jgi:hypothetical protein
MPNIESDESVDEFVYVEQKTRSGQTYQTKMTKAEAAKFEARNKAVEEPRPVTSTSTGKVRGK